MLRITFVVSVGHFGSDVQQLLNRVDVVDLVVPEWLELFLQYFSFKPGVWVELFVIVYDSFHTSLHIIKFTKINMGVKMFEVGLDCWESFLYLSVGFNQGRIVSA